jgi:hypothetical protein
MKIIEAMKKIKDLQKKAEDLRQKVKAHCADLDFETPLYADQKGQIQSWLQAHSDILKEILSLRVAIQKVNLSTDVTIELGGIQVTKTIAEWIHRRRDLATTEMEMWKGLTDRNLKEGAIQQTSGISREVKIRRYYDAAEKDRKVDLYRSEPSIIDATLEVVNAVTEIDR